MRRKPRQRSYHSPCPGRSSRSCCRSGTAACTRSSGSGPRALLGRVGAAGRHARRRGDARGVDPPASRREGRRARRRPSRAARVVERDRSRPRPARARDRVPRDRSRGRRSGACPRTPSGTPWTTCPRQRSTTARSCSPAASACGASSRTPTSASPSRPAAFTLSELRGLYAAALGHDLSATNLKRVLLRRNVLEPTGGRREPGRAGGRPAEVYRFRTRRLEITDPFATLRPPS